MTEAFDFESARAAILRYQPAWRHSVVVHAPERRLMVGYGFDLDRADAPEMIRALGEDFELVRDGLLSLSGAQMLQLFDAQLRVAVEHAELRVPGFGELPGERQTALLELIISRGEALFDSVCALAEEQGALAATASEWFDQGGRAPYLGLQRDVVRRRGQPGRPKGQDVKDVDLGSWAEKMASSVVRAAAHYESDAGMSFGFLPDDAQSALALVARDGEDATGFWDAVTEHRWSEAVRELGERPDFPERSRRHATMLLERARAQGRLPAQRTRRKPRASIRRGGSVVVIARKFGRLGNRLLLFAHIIGAALEHDLTVINPAFDRYAEDFPALADDVLCRFPPAEGGQPVPAAIRKALVVAASAGADELGRRQQSGADIGLIRLERDEYLDLNSEPFLEMVRSHPIVVIDGWYFRNEDNCHRHGDAIRTFFTPAADTLERAQAPVRELKASGRPVVGVHMRRGDYASFGGGKFYFSYDDYGRVMSELADGPTGSGAAFFVCSDEPVPDGVFGRLRVSRGARTAIEDLYGLAACDFLIGPPSTFSRWASFYGRVPLLHLKDPSVEVRYEQFIPDRGLGSGAGTVPWSGTKARSRNLVAG